MRENTYQAGLIRRIERRFPGCLVLKNDSGYRQGIPDLTILYKDRWAVLEVKAAQDSDTQPNQEHYVRALGSMSFAAFIYPANEQEVLNAIQESFRTGRTTRVSQR